MSETNRTLCYNQPEPTKMNNIENKHREKEVLDIARLYIGTCFSQEYPKEYQHAYTYGYIEELRHILSLTGKRQISVEERKEEVIEIAKNYAGTNFRKDFNKEYLHSYYYKYISEVREILNMRVLKKRSKEEVFEIAKNYAGIRFSKDFKKEYLHAHNNGYIDELRTMLNIKNGGNRTSIEIIEKRKKEALEKATTYMGTQFTIDYPKEYQHAKIHGYVDELRRLANIILNRMFIGSELKPIKV